MSYRSTEAEHQHRRSRIPTIVDYLFVCLELHSKQEHAAPVAFDKVKSENSLGTARFLARRQNESIDHVIGEFAKKREQSPISWQASLASQYKPPVC